MKKLIAIFLWFAASALVGSAQTHRETRADIKLSPAEQAIAEARQAIEKNPNKADPYSSLALALARRARETSDVSYYSQAEQALKTSLAIAPENFLAEKTRVWLLLGKHEFAQALEAAKRLNKRVPDDVTVYGFLTDANAELGNYDDAEQAANWMLRLRPGNIPGLTRAAYLRELFGDYAGALDLMNMAFQSTPPSQVEDGAWILTQMAHLRLVTGKTTEAENLLYQALAQFPNYHYALGNLAKVRIAQKRFGEAVDLLQQRYRSAAHAENLYDLAEALELAGRSNEAKAAFEQFEEKSLAESARADNSNRELIFYYTDHAHQPAKALEVAQHEYMVRHDVYTLDAYAWALHVNGRDAEARKQVELALAVGTLDANLLRHAGEIAPNLGDGSR
jgi:tetratricopeptide (TPR) repeat protein